MGLTIFLADPGFGSFEDKHEYIEKAVCEAVVKTLLSISIRVKPTY